MPPRRESRMDRAKKERMYFMGRATPSANAAAAFIVTGQSGKVWTVQIPKKDLVAAPSPNLARFRCNCPDNLMRKGTCKHMLFVCLRVLQIPEEQLKGLDAGKDINMGVLHEALERVAPDVDPRYAAPEALKERLKAIAGDFEADGTVPRVPKREPEEGESCPICYEELLDGGELVYCGYGCGKPVHTECFRRYTDAQKTRYSRGEVEDHKLRCVTCRVDWEVESCAAVGNQGMLLNRRAINLARYIVDESEDEEEKEEDEDEDEDEEEYAPSPTPASSKRKGSSSRKGASSSKAGPSKSKASTKKSKGRAASAAANGSTRTISKRRTSTRGAGPSASAASGTKSKRRATKAEPSTSAAGGTKSKRRATKAEPQVAETTLRKSSRVAKGGISKAAHKKAGRKPRTSQKTEGGKKAGSSKGWEGALRDTTDAALKAAAVASAASRADRAARRRGARNRS